MIIKQGHAFWALASSGHSVLGEHANSPALYSALNALLAWRDPQDAQRISFQQGTLPEKSPETKPGCGVDCTGVNRMGLGFYHSYCDAGLKCGLLREAHMTHVYLVISNRSHVKS